MGSIGRILDRGIDTTTSFVQAGGALRGQVAFERWYFHYHNKLGPKQAAKDPSIQVFCRLWAVASTIESFVKTLIVFASVLYYSYMENETEVKKQEDVLSKQFNSLHYSFIAIFFPEIAAKKFSVYRKPPIFNEKKPTECKLAEFVHYHATKESWGTIYTGKTTLEMLINTH